MDLLEIYADEEGETHFRRTELDMELHNFAPPSKPINISKELPSTSSMIVVAPPGWDDAFHPTPRKQLATPIYGSVTVQATDGETVRLEAGNIILLNDQDSKGHLTQVLGTQDAAVLLVGLQDAEP